MKQTKLERIISLTIPLLKKWRLFLLILLFSPGFLWITLRPARLFAEWKNAGSYASNNIRSVFSQDNLVYIGETRWNAFGFGREFFLSRIYYNKVYVLADNLFGYVSFFSPRIYFQAGDGSEFSPPKVEPLALPLFAFWVLGILSLLKKKDLGVLFAVLALGFLAFVIGKRTMAFLTPVLVLYAFICAEGVNFSLGKKVRAVFVVCYVLYSAFLIGRMFVA